MQHFVLKVDRLEHGSGSKEMNMVCTCVVQKYTHLFITKNIVSESERRRVKKIKDKDKNLLVGWRERGGSILI